MSSRQKLPTPASESDDPTKHAKSPQMMVALAYVEMFNTGNLDSFAPLLSAQLRHRTHPLALGRPFRTKEEYTALLKGYSNWLQVEVFETNESPGRVWIHGIGRGNPPCGGTYENEYVFMLKIAPSDQGMLQIVEIKEYMDSSAINDLMARMQRWKNSLPQAKM